MKDRPLPIPKSFQLLGHTITIQYNNEISTEDDKLGKCYLLKDTMVLCDNKNLNRPQIVTETTFIHEVLEFIAFHCGIELLRTEEGHRAIDLLAEAFVQVWKTAQL